MIFNWFKRPKYKIASDILRRNYRRDREFYVLSKEMWDRYLEELPHSLREQYRVLGLPRVSHLKRYKSPKVIRRLGIPCLEYREIPVFSEEHIDMVVRKYSE